MPRVYEDDEITVSGPPAAPKPRVYEDNEVAPAVQPQQAQQQAPPVQQVQPSKPAPQMQTTTPSAPTTTTQPAIGFGASATAEGTLGANVGAGLSMKSQSPEIYRSMSPTGAPVEFDPMGQEKAAAAKAEGLLSEDLRTSLTAEVEKAITNSPAPAEQTFRSMSPTGAPVERKITVDPKERLQNRLKQARRKDERGFWEQIGKTKIPFVSGSAEVLMAAGVMGAMKRLEKGDATHEDMLTILEFDNESRRNTTFGGDVGSILAEMPAFVGEFVATGGIYNAGKKFGEKASLGAIKSLISRKLRKGLAGRAALVAIKSAGILTGGIAQATLGVPHRIIKGTIERMMPEKLGKADGDRLASVVTKEGDGFLTALAKATGDNVIEMLSERSGAHLMKGAGKLTGFEGLNRAAAARIQGVKAAIIKKWVGGSPNRTVKQFLNMIKKKAAWDGVIGEMGEERLGELLRWATGVEDELIIKSPEGYLAEAIAFLGAPIGGAALEIGTAVQQGKEIQQEVAQKEQEVAETKQEFEDTRPEPVEVTPEQRAEQEAPLVPTEGQASPEEVAQTKAEFEQATAAQEADLPIPIAKEVAQEDAPIPLVESSVTFGQRSDTAKANTTPAQIAEEFEPGPARDAAMTERRNAASREVDSLKPGDTIVDEGGDVVGVVSRVGKNVVEFEEGGQFTDNFLPKSDVTSSMMADQYGAWSVQRQQKQSSPQKTAPARDIAKESAEILDDLSRSQEWTAEDVSKADIALSQGIRDAIPAKHTKIREQLLAQVPRVNNPARLAGFNEKLEAARQKVAEADAKAEATAVAKEQKSAKAEAKKAFDKARSLFGEDFYKARPEVKQALNDLVGNVDASNMSQQSLDLAAEAINQAAENPDIQLPKKARDALARLGKTPMSKMTAEELTNLANGITSLVHQQKMSDSFESGGKKLTRDMAVEDMQSHLGETKKSKRGAAKGTDKGVVSKALGDVQLGTAETLDTLSRRLGSTMHDLLYKTPIEQGTDQMIRETQAGQESFAETLAKHGLERKGLVKRGKQQVKVELEDGRTLPMTKQDIYSMALMAQSQEGLDALLNKDGITLPNGAEYEQINSQDLQSIFGKLDESDAQMLRAIRDHVNSKMTQEYSDIFLDMYGYRPKTSPNYWSIHRHAEALSSKEVDVSQGLRKASLQQMEGWSALHERVPHAEGKVKIKGALDTLASMAMHHAQLKSYGQNVRQISAILSDQNFRKSVREQFGESYLNTMETLYSRKLASDAGAVQKAEGKLGRTMKKARTKFQKSVLAGNVPVWLLQPTSIIQAANEMGPGVLTQLRPRGKKANAEIDRVMSLEYAPQLWQRKEMGYVTQEVGEQAFENTTLNFVEGPGSRDWTGAGMRAFDQMAIRGIVAQALKEGSKRGKAGKALYEYAGQRAQQVVGDTQPMFDTKNRTKLGSSPAELIKTVNRFRSFRDQMLVNTTKQIQSYKEGKQGLAKTTAKIANNFIVAGAVNVIRKRFWQAAAVTAGALAAGGGDDEVFDEGDGKESLTDWAGSTAGMFPGGDRIVTLIDSIFTEDVNDKKFKRKRAIKQDIPLLELADATVEVYDAFAEGAAKRRKNTKDSDTRRLLKQLEKSATAIGRWTGLPTESAYRTIKPALQAATGTRQKKNRRRK